MSRESLAQWQEANQAWLTAQVERIRRRIEARLANAPEPEYAAELAWTATRPPAISAITDAFRLSDFERDVLLLCAGVELNAEFASLCASARGAGAKAPVTFGLALAALGGAHWSAMAPAAPLRWWHLVQLATQDGPTQSPLRIDERILHCLAGIDHLDSRIASVAELLEPVDSLMPSQLPAIERIAGLWHSSQPMDSAAAIQIGSSDALLARHAAACACHALGLQALQLQAHDVPQVAQERAMLARLCEREAALSACVVVLDCSRAHGGSPEERALLSLADELRSRVILIGTAAASTLNRAVVRVDVRPSSVDERRRTWVQALGPFAASLNGTIERLAMHFELPQATVRTLAAAASTSGESIEVVESTLWESCRLQGRSRLEELAERVEPVADWSDLILPPSQLELLREIAVHVRLRGQVFDTWGFGSRTSRANGTCAVFAGPSGTGKTLAAEVLARDLRLDLFRVDLARTVSKYIGETEKNLARIFDAGERSGAILLFDEADALFGKRSDVRDSHDRYANIEVSYLLQRMESFRGGLAILTTNMKSALDQSFWRRLRFVIQFPFPDTQQRIALWRGAFPGNVPRAELDLEKLARLSVTGANIRNIAMNAAFRAADAGAAVDMSHVLWAARQEYAKLDRTLSDAEVRGWS